MIRRPRGQKYSFLLFAAAIIMLTVLFVVALGRLGQEHTDEVLTKNYQQQVTVAATNVAQDVGNEFATYEKQLRLMANVEDVRSLNAAVCQPEIEQLYKDFGTTGGNIGRIGPDKRFYCSKNTALIGTDATKFGSYVSDIFNDPNHHYVVSRIVKPVGSPSHLLAIHIPVYDKQQKFQGTLGGAISMEDIGRSDLQSVKLTPHSFVSMFDDNGDILYHPVSSFIGKQFFDTDIQKFTNHNQALNAAARTAMSGKPATARYIVAGGEERFSTFAPVQIAPGRHVVVSVVLPVKDIQALNKQLNLNSSLIAVGVFMALILCVFAAAITSYLNRRIFSPIESMGLAADAIASGDIAHKVPTHGGSYEVAKLGRALNAMVARLREYSTSLEKEVAAKTDELNNRYKQAEEQNKQLENTKRAVLNVLEDLNQEKDNLQITTAKDEAIINSIGDGLIIFDSKGRIERFNKTAQDLLGYTEKEVLGKAAVQALKAVDPSGKPIPQAERPVMSALDTRQDVSTMLGYVTKDGHQVIVQLNVGPIMQGGKPIGAVEVFRDITEERALDKAKDDFLSLVSHQLQTPATAVKQFLGLILEGYAGKIKREQSEYVEKAYKYNEDQIAIIQDLLEVARMESGKASLTLAPLQARQIVSQVMEMQQEAIQRNKHSLVLDVPEALTFVADETKIKMCLGNLLSNAIKYTPTGGTITISALQDKTNTTFTVHDTGIGIAAKDLKKLFGRFSRVGSSATQQIPGTGIGLFLCKQIAEMHGGTVTVASKVGHGTTFTVQLPIREA